MKSIDKDLIQINLTSLSIEPENDYNLSQYLDLEVTSNHEQVLILGTNNAYGLSSTIPYGLSGGYYIKMTQPLDELVLNIDNSPVVINRDHVSTMLKLSDTDTICAYNLDIIRDHFNGVVICIDTSVYKVKFKLNKEIIDKCKLRTHYAFDRLVKCNSYILGVTNFLNENKDKLMPARRDGNIEFKVPLRAVQSLYLATTAVNHRADQMTNLFDLLINEHCIDTSVNILTGNYEIYIFWTDDNWYRRRENGLTPDTEVAVLICKK